MSNFNYIEYLKNNPLLKKDNPKIISEQIPGIKITGGYQEKFPPGYYDREHLRALKQKAPEIQNIQSQLRDINGYIENYGPLDENIEDAIEALDAALTTASFKIEGIKKTNESSMPKNQTSKMSKKALKAKIREEILATLNEEEDYERIGREVEYGVGAGSDEDDLDMEDIFGAYGDEDFASMGDEDMDEMYISEQDKDKKEDAPEEEVAPEEEMDVDVDVAAEEPMAGGGGEGLSAEEQKIQNNLKVAYDNAIAIGDQKLADQIGNSITFFTRTHVVER